MFRTAVIAGLAAIAAYAAPIPFTGQIVVTIQSRQGQPPADLHREDVMAYSSKTRMRVTDLQKLDGANAGMQFFILLDDSTASSSLGVHLPELRKFVNSMPSTTEVAIGYMRNGGFSLEQGFTADHAAAAAALRLPNAIPGGNGSPYFALSYLAKHWPSTQATSRRTVLMLTDGIDRYYSNNVIDDPYVNTAIGDAQKKGIGVYAIYLRGAGIYGRSGWTVSMGQSRLIQVADQTGGAAYFEGLRNPVSILPFLDDLNSRLSNQYRIEFEAIARGLQPVSVRTEVTGLKIVNPLRAYIE